MKYTNKIIMPKRKLAVGSNQFVTRRRRKTTSRQVRSIMAAIILVITIGYVGIQEATRMAYAALDAQTEIISPLPQGEPSVSPTMTIIPTASPTATPTVQPDNSPEQEEIREYIKEVFGKDSSKAFKLLSCENSSLNPKAVNTVGNSPAGSRDIGVFQINEYWQKTQGKFLLNPKINIEIAHLLFEENGKSFKMWSCGKKLNI